MRLAHWTATVCGSNPGLGKNLVCAPEAKSATMSTLTVHGDLEDETVREKTCCGPWCQKRLAAVHHIIEE